MTILTAAAAPSSSNLVPPGTDKKGRLAILDGWRAISILLVLATHGLPIPKDYGLNQAIGLMGMSLFFTLSGFLITEQLHARHNIYAFLVRRFFRIAPLAWLYATFAVLLLGAGFRSWIAHLFFSINYDFTTITALTEHFWSLCVEAHFYVAIALIMVITRFRGFLILPVVWICLVVIRLVFAPRGTIETHFRVDEILSGSCLALVHMGYLGPKPRAIILRIPILGLVLALVLASLPLTPHFNALRGMSASLLIGNTIFRSDSRNLGWLKHRALRYIAEISYALYVIHPATMYGWLGSGPKLVKYTKRILSFSLTLGLAHLSTFYFEKPLTNLGKKIAADLEKT
jgi:peptidoglycan/LPS O-acetylase OafA/YrhL